MLIMLYTTGSECIYFKTTVHNYIWCSVTFHPNKIV